MSRPGDAPGKSHKNDERAGKRVSEKVSGVLATGEHKAARDSGRGLCLNGKARSMRAPGHAPRIRGPAGPQCQRISKEPLLKAPFFFCFFFFPTSIQAVLCEPSLSLNQVQTFAAS